MRGRWLMELSAEMMTILEKINFKSKKELLCKLERLYFEALESSMKGKIEIVQILFMTLKQVNQTKESELLDYKKYFNTKQKRKN